MKSLLDNLNESQKKAVEWAGNTLLVLSGAGTGKTRVLTARIEYILRNFSLKPWQIMAITFTNRAANTIKERLAPLEIPNVNINDLWCGTFHSVCLRILRRNAELVGLRPDFLIAGEDEQKRIIKNILNSSATKTSAVYVEEFSRIKDKGLSALGSKDKLFGDYNAELARLNFVDFGDIILKVLLLFRDNKDVLEKYQNQFKHILVDEFQDINGAQMQFLEFLMPPKNMRPDQCLFCVGDEDQSIYSWRGAEIKHILDFEKKYGSCAIINPNYRSTENILGVANSLINNNKQRVWKNKKLKSFNGEMGDLVHVLTMPTDRDEARLIADYIRYNSCGNYDNFAILIRTGNLSRLFEEEFTIRRIPFRIYGAVKFYDRMEIRDTISYLRLLVHQFDDISFERIIGKPSRNIGKAALEKIRAMGGTLMESLRTAQLSTKQRAKANEFLSAFDFDWQSMPPKKAAMELLERTGYLQMWRDSKDPDARDRLENIMELIGTTISKYDTLDEFLEQAALLIVDDDEPSVLESKNKAVSIMTMHAAKGMEFDTVFLPAWEENIVPNIRAIKDGAEEEERRLAYVAITRAKNNLIITNSSSRFVYDHRENNEPSRFISEIDSNFLKFQGNPYYQPRRENYSADWETSKQAKDSAVGQLISHDELGSGVVIEQDGDILTVAFKHKGIKKVARNFVKFLQ